MEFQEHKNFTSEIKDFSKKHKTVYLGMESLKRLLSVQFDPISPNVVIHPGKIHRVQEFDLGISAIWKIEMAIPNSGLRPSQWPRVWFSVTGNTIVFLVLATHQDNYDNAYSENQAIDRFSDFG